MQRPVHAIQSTIISVNHINFFIVKNTFKAATCFGSTDPSSGPILRTYPFTFQYIWDPKCLHRWCSYDICYVVFFTLKLKTSFKMVFKINVYIKRHLCSAKIILLLHLQVPGLLRTAVCWLRIYLRC